MNVEENRAKFLAALRSGKYQQGRERLHPGARFCCLGVACDVIDPEGWSSDGYHHQQRDFPGERVWRALGWESDNPPIGKAATHASILNDQHNKDFAYIADRFEDYFKAHPVVE